MSRFLAQALVLIGVIAALTTAAGIAVAAPAPSPLVATAAANRGAVAARQKGKHKKPAGPSLSVMGFGVNRLFVPRGTTVTSSSMCDEMVGADTPIGPPQNVYLVVYLRATGIPAAAPTQIADSLPEEELDEPNLSPPVPWSKAFAEGSFPFGGPPGSQKNLFHLPLFSASAEEGSNEGPSAEEFDGTYSFTTSVKVGPHTLSSTAKVTVDCPSIR